MVNLKNKRRGRRGRKNQLAGPGSSHCAIPLLLSFAIGFVRVCVCKTGGDREEGVFHISHDMFCLGL